LPRSLPRGGKSLPDHRVERSVGGEVLGRREFFKPEVEDVVGLHRAVLKENGFQRPMVMRKQLSKV
jgi:hypothetical protein